MGSSPIDAISKLDTEADFDEEEVYSERIIDEPASKNPKTGDDLSPGGNVKPPAEPENIANVSAQQTVTGGKLGNQMTGAITMKKEGAVAAIKESTEKIRQAKLKGYTGDICSSCGSLTMVRNGTCLKCTTCGDTSGCS